MRAINVTAKPVNGSGTRAINASAAGVHTLEKQHWKVHTFQAGSPLQCSMRNATWQIGEVHDARAPSCCALCRALHRAECCAPCCATQCQCAGLGRHYPNICPGTTSACPYVPIQACPGENVALARNPQMKSATKWWTPVRHYPNICPGKISTCPHVQRGMLMWQLAIIPTSATDSKARAPACSAAC